MFEIEVDTGAEGKMWLRGCSDGTIELCKMGTLAATKTEPVRDGLVAFKYYANPVQAFERILKMRVGSCEAKSLGELVLAIKAIRTDILKQLATTVTTLMENNDADTGKVQGLGNGVPPGAGNVESGKTGSRESDLGIDTSEVDVKD